ncbi:MAG: polyphosphate:AMP phosphotransferase [Lachnospiraceae bacterium]|nr:polyphosphate:AMP phosphotransferase [Lachnospiraceae bacterium]
MLSDVLKVSPEEKLMKAQIKTLTEKLALQQMQMAEKKLPVVVLVEGWDTAGKGSLIGGLINPIDPRFYRVATLERFTEEDQRLSFIGRYFKELPENGKFVFLDSGWMTQVTREYLYGTISDEQYQTRIQSINNFERQLADNGYLLVKLFLHITEDEQEKRVRKLNKSQDTSWRISEDDTFQNGHYGRFYQVFESYIRATDTEKAPWHIIDSSSKRWARLQALEILTDALETALNKEKVPAAIPENVFPLVKQPKLAEISLADKVLEDKEYDKRLKELQKELRGLHNKIYRKKIPVIIAYEGWDAAGKGGNIKRVAKALDPRGFEVIPIASPLPHEKARHFLWRFYVRLPKTGHITVFDRTWYGRVMVERLEGFCSENDWQRAYNEINEFEKDLTDWGAVVIKFWVQIDKDTQLKRFTDRQNTPEKQWKITDEDWRNREKWDLYEAAVDEMIAKTSTEFAPWHVLESVDKKYARIKALEIIVEELKKACKR